MSHFISTFSIKEVQLDEHDNIIAEFEKDLPHGHFLICEMMASWNEMNMAQYFDGILKDKVNRAIMTGFTDKEGHTCGKIRVICVPGFRLSAKRRAAIEDQISAQFCDGWGEGFFGYANIMTAPDGTRLMVE